MATDPTAIPLFRLPDLPRALASRVSDLAERVMVHNDLTALQPLLDALGDAGRDKDVREIRFAVYVLSRRLSKSPRQRRAAWDSFCSRVVGAVMWDLFDFGMCVAAADQTLGLDALAAELFTADLEESMRNAATTEDVPDDEAYHDPEGWPGYAVRAESREPLTDPDGRSLGYTHSVVLVRTYAPEEHVDEQRNDPDPDPAEPAAPDPAVRRFAGEGRPG